MLNILFGGFGEGDEKFFSHYSYECATIIGMPSDQTTKKL
jgi:hypothetical protein